MNTLNSKAEHTVQIVGREYQIIHLQFFESKNALSLSVRKVESDVGTKSSASQSQHLIDSLELHSGPSLN